MIKKSVFLLVCIVVLSGLLVITIILKERKDISQLEVNKTVIHKSSNEFLKEPNTKPWILNKTEDSEMANMTDNLIVQTTRDIEQIKYEEALHDPAKFTLMAHQHEMSYLEAVQNFKTEDLEKMYPMFNQDKYKNEWRFIAQLIGFVSNRGNKNSIDVLLQYLKRPDVWSEIKEDRIKSFDVGMGKILCLEWIGMIGGEYAEKILLKATTQEGAEEIAKEWIQFTEGSFPSGRERAIAYIRGRALLGLIYCQSPQGVEILERMYKDEKEKCIQKGEKFSWMFNETVAAMAYKSLVDEHGLYKAFELYGSDKRPEVISEYIKKYWLLNEQL